MHKILRKLTEKKVDMSDIVSPTPSKSASRALKNALRQSYNDQKIIRDRATALRNS